MRFSVAVSAASAAPRRPSAGASARSPSRAISSAACGDVLHQLALDQSARSSRGRRGRAARAARRRAARPQGLASHAIAASRPTETLPSHGSAVDAPRPEQDLAERLALRRARSTSATVLALMSEQTASAAAPPSSQAPGRSGRAARARPTVELGRQHGERDLAGVEGDLVRLGAPEDCQRRCRRRRRASATPRGASTIAATQTASSSENCSSSPPCGNVSMSWAPSADAPAISSSAKASRLGASGPSTRSATASATPPADDDAGDEHPRRRRAARRDGGRGHCHRPSPRTWRPRTSRPRTSRPSRRRPSRPRPSARPPTPAAGAGRRRRRGDRAGDCSAAARPRRSPRTSPASTRSRRTPRRPTGGRARRPRRSRGSGTPSPSRSPTTCCVPRLASSGPAPVDGVRPAFARGSPAPGPSSAASPRRSRRRRRSAPAPAPRPRERAVGGGDQDALDLVVRQRRVGVEHARRDARDDGGGLRGAGALEHRRPEAGGRAERVDRRARARGRRRSRRRGPAGRACDAVRGRPALENAATVSSARSAVPFVSAAPTVITNGSSAGFEIVPRPALLPAETTTTRPAAHARSTAQSSGSTP